MQINICSTLNSDMPENGKLFLPTKWIGTVWSSAAHQRPVRSHSLQLCLRDPVYKGVWGAHETALGSIGGLHEALHSSPDVHCIFH